MVGPKLALVAVALGLAVSVSPARAMSLGDGRAETASTEPTSQPDASTALLRITVGPTIVDRSLLPGWITSRNRDLAHEIPVVEGHDQWIAVEIAGATYDYRVSVVAMRDGKPVGSVGEPVRCICNGEKLLTLVDDRIDAAVAELRAVEPTEVAEPAAVVMPSPPIVQEPPRAVAEADAPRRRPLGALGYTGIAVGVLGAGALGAGIPLAVRPDGLRGAPPTLERYSTRPPGIALAVGGGVALATGVTLLIVDGVRRRQRPVAFLPTFVPGRAGLTITRRF